MHWTIQLVFLGAVLATLYAIACACWVLLQPIGIQALQIPYQAIRDGAAAFMRIQYGTIAGVGTVIFLLLWLTPKFGHLTAIGFAIGAVCSAVAGLLGMAVAVRANVRTAAAAHNDLKRALQIAYRSGSVTGFLLSGLALASVAGFYWWLHFLDPAQPNLAPMAGLGFGASLVSVFGRLGGGIFTKAADVGADLAGKIEQNIPEDDPRNPAVIADNVGDNVGDCAGMAADVYESYSVTLIATILVAAWLAPDMPHLQYYPLFLGSAALVATLIGGQFLWLPKSGNVGIALMGVVWISLVLALVGYYFASLSLPTGDATFSFSPLKLFYCALVGLGVGLGLVFNTGYFTGPRYRPVQSIARASCQGHATNIITGLAMSMTATAIPAVIVAIGIVGAYQLSGIYGIAVASTALLAITPIVMSIDAFGPVVDNAGGIVEMAGLPESVRIGTDALDAAGNMTKALTKVFAIGSAGLAALVLFAAYRLEFGPQRLANFGFPLDDPFVLGGLFSGALLPFWFCGMAMNAVGKSASSIVEEVRRQFRENPEILAGKALPNYSRAVAMLTRSAIIRMIAPGSLPVVAPTLAAVAASWMPPGAMAQWVGGMMIGALATGLMLALALCIGGGAWDNAKKYIEAGHYGGKGSPAHHAAVTGDTVGDPCKDTAGPAINPMIKVLSLMAVLLVPFLR